MPITDTDIRSRYAQNQLQPPARIPGFVFHQTERTDDNGTMPCAGAGSGARNHWLCYDMNVRDFDLLGYKYSLLSTVGTAGLNVVLTMIPARDVEEFKLLPQADVSFIRGWLQWTDSHLDFLRNTMPIATLLGPGLGRVDGTAAMHGAISLAPSPHATPARAAAAQRKQCPTQVPRHCAHSQCPPSSLSSRNIFITRARSWAHACACR
jgi:hypothetical protein